MELEVKTSQHIEVINSISRQDYICNLTKKNLTSVAGCSASIITRVLLETTPVENELNLLDTLFFYPKVEDKIDNLLSIINYFKGLPLNNLTEIYVDFLNNIFTIYTNVYIKHIMKLKDITIDEFIEDFEELVKYLISNNNKSIDYGLDKLNNVIASTMEINQSRPDILKNFILKHRVKDDNDRTWLTIPLLKIEPMFKYRGAHFASLRNILNILTKRGAPCEKEDRFAIYNILDTVYKKFQPFRELGYIEIITTDIDNLRGYNTYYCFVTPNENHSNRLNYRFIDANNSVGLL